MIDHEDIAKSAIIGRIAEVFADQDARRMMELDRALRLSSKCRYCGARLADVSMEKHPGVCGRAKCLGKARKDAMKGRQR